ncbi:hypothetical protein [Pseudonocardia cypriaca]|uniref:Uncharacterized protein n=1 Tax=Pseudonocardia cypriaca TaxID=882449 RepID=A0A543FV12_9PSEU|nr:hypothetical protein [Pseudonocardia cypriaca]TQM37653.1 hypothetical protein FB388_4870 [Pseudonocardia cypriaca]
MKITRVLRDSCPSGIDCDRIFDTSGPDIVVQGRIVTDPAVRAALGLPVPPPGEAYVLIERRLVPELLCAREAG